jgi:perosamine synthetase
MSNFVPVNEPLIGQEEKDNIADCLATGWISSEGPYVRQFETEFAKRSGREYGIAVANGSMALEAAVVALGIGADDEVIMPAFTIISCATAIVRAGAVPVVVDCEPDTWNMDVAAIENLITPRTRAIMAVHIYGLPVDMDPLMKLARRHGLLVIEDAAEAIGQTCRGRPCGSFGDISIFSFYPNKLVTTGEGGMIVTNSLSLAERCRSLRNLCFIPESRFVHEDMGWNMRMTNLQAAIGVAQLHRLDAHLARKIEIGHLYNELLGGINSLALPLARTEYADNIYWVYGLVINDGIKMTARDAMQQLGKAGIGTRPFFHPMHQQPVFRKMGLFHGVSCPVAERIAGCGFYIPSGLAMTNEQVNRVVDAVKELFA